MASWTQKLVAATVFVLLATGVSPGSALNLRVQGRSTLSVDLSSAGTRVVVRGQLRDDLGQPLPQRAVRVAVLDEPSGRRQEGRTVRTNRRGRFSSTFDLAPGTYRVEAGFEATGHLTGARADQKISVDRAPVDLAVRGPEFVHGDAAPVFARISGTVEGMGLALPVVLENGAGARKRMKLDEDGRLRADIAHMLQYGRNRISVRVPESAHREGASTSLTVDRFRALGVEASVDAVFERLQRGAAVDGTVRGGDRPLDGIEVRVKLEPIEDVRSGETSSGKRSRTRRNARKTDRDGTLREKVSTNADGTFHAFFGREDLPDGKWHASVKVVPDVGATVGREVGTIEIDRTVSRTIVNGAAGLALLALLFVGFREVWEVVREKLETRRQRRRQRERRERAFRQEESLEPMPAPDSAPSSREPVDRQSVRGYVWNAWRSEPVPDAEIKLTSRDGFDESETTDADGRFAFDDLDRGTYRLSITAEYFVRGRFEFEIPHGGRLSDCRFELVPVPLKIRRLFESLVELARGENLWGTRSPHEMRGAIRGALYETAPVEEDEPGPFVRRVQRLVGGEDSELETAVDYLEALTDIVQETYFSPRRYDEETWETARRLALRLREEIEARQDG